MRANRRGGCTLQKIYSVAAALALTAVLPCFAPQTARAQSVSSPVPIRVKIGIHTPADNGTRSAYGSPLFLGELEIGLPSLTGGRYAASIGYERSSRDGRTLEVIPITASRLFSPPNPAAGLTGTVYYGLGAGVYLMRAKGNGASANKNNLGGFGVVGYQFPGGGFLVEAKYHLVSGSAGGAKASGLALMVGKRL